MPKYQPRIEAEKTAVEKGIEEALEDEYPEIEWLKNQRRWKDQLKNANTHMVQIKLDMCPKYKPEHLDFISHMVQIKPPIINCKVIILESLYPIWFK